MIFRRDSAIGLQELLALAKWPATSLAAI